MVGVLSVGPYNPKFLAVADFRSGLTLGKGLKIGAFELLTGRGLLGAWCSPGPPADSGACCWQGRCALGSVSAGASLWFTSKASNFTCTAATSTASASPNTGSGDCPSIVLGVPLAQLLPSPRAVAAQLEGNSSAAPRPLALQPSFCSSISPTVSPQPR